MSYQFSPEKLDYLKSVLSYDPDLGVFRRRAGTNRNRRLKNAAATAKTYKQIRVGSEIYYAHILAWWFVTGGPVPAGFEIDHRDRDKQNFRWSNLRLVTSGRNKNNMTLRSDNTHGVAGLRYHPKPDRWSVHITVDNKSHHLGRFATKAEAIRARLAAEQKHLGEVVSMQAYALLELEENRE